jgi:hypothetical protein
MQELREHAALLDDAIAAMERLQAVQRGFGYSAQDDSGSTGPISRSQAAEGLVLIKRSHPQIQRT